MSVSSSLQKSSDVNQTQILFSLGLNNLKPKYAHTQWEDLNTGTRSPCGKPVERLCHNTEFTSSYRYVQAGRTSGEWWGKGKFLTTEFLATIWAALLLCKSVVEQMQSKSSFLNQGPETAIYICFLGCIFWFILPKILLINYRLTSMPVHTFL